MSNNLPPGGGDGGGGDDGSGGGGGSGFSPSRLNHPYQQQQQQQHPRQSRGHDGHRSSRDPTHHVYAGGNRDDYYSSYGGNFNPPHYYNNNNRHQPVGMGPPHEVAVGARYYHQQFIQPQPENTKTEELLKKLLLDSAEMRKQHETDMKKMETKQKKMLENVETMQTMLRQRQSEPERVGAAVRQQNAIKLEQPEIIEIIDDDNDDDDDKIDIKKEKDDESAVAELQHQPSGMDMDIQTVTMASSASSTSSIQATFSNEGPATENVSDTLRNTDSTSEETMVASFGGSKDKGNGGSGSGNKNKSEDNNNKKKKVPPVHAVTAVTSKKSNTSNPSSSTQQPQIVPPKEIQSFNKMSSNPDKAKESDIAGDGERRKRKVPDKFVAETSQDHNSKRNNNSIQIQNNIEEQRTQTLRRRSLSSSETSDKDKKRIVQVYDDVNSTKTNSSKRSKVTVGSQKVLGNKDAKSVIKFAVEHPNDDKIQGLACERLRTILTSIDKDNMTSIDEDNARNVISIDGVQMICNAMKNHRGKSMVISEGCCTLSHFIKFHPDVSSKIAAEGAIDFIIAAISRWGKSSSKKIISNDIADMVLKMGCETLNQLSYCDGNFEKIINSDGMNSVQTAMKNNPDRIEFLNLGCNFLINMTHHRKDTSPTLKNKVVAVTEVVPVILKAVLKKKNSIKVRVNLRYNVCALIRNLAVLPEAKLKVSESESNAIAVIIKIWNATGDDDADADMKEVASKALQYLATDSTVNQAKIQKELFLAIKSNQDHPEQLVRTLYLVEELCINDERIAHKIARKDGINIIMNVLKNNPGYAMIQVAAFDVIGAIGGKSSKDYAPGLAKVIIAAMTNHNDTLDARDVQVSGCDALFEISHHPSTHKIHPSTSRTFKEIFKKTELLNILLRVKKDFKPNMKRIDKLIRICNR